MTKAAAGLATEAVRSSSAKSGSWQVGQPLSRQEVSLVGLTRDVDNSVLDFGKQAKRTHLLVADVVLLLLPLQTRVVSVQLEALV